MHQRLIIAHRGHCVAAPEQTFAAYALAVEHGAAMIEVDLRFSRDGVGLLLHDARLERTTSGTGAVSGLDWADLAGLDAGSWFGTEFQSERIPRLDELFEFAAGHDVALCIEAKGADTEEALRGARHAALEISRRGRLERDVVASFEHRALAEVAREFHGLRTAPDRLPERGASLAADLIAQARGAGASIIQHHFADLDPKVVAEVQAAGVEVWAWPPANLQEARQAVASGAIGLMGDDVTAIVAAVRQAKD